MVKSSEIELPIIFKNQALFKSGRWNPVTNDNFEFSKDMVNNSVKNTKWSALNKRLYVKHDGADDVSKWKGKIENPYAKDGVAYGDVQIWDPIEGVQILYGEKPVAISADIEYNEAGVMYFTGFAIENDPGVHDAKMFLSDAVKNELSGMYHASFSAELDTSNVQKEMTDTVEPEREPAVKTDVQTNPIDNQGAERGFINDKQTENMTENQTTENVSSEKSDIAKDIVERIEVLENTMKEEAKQAEPVKVEAAKAEETKVEEVKTEPAKTEDAKVEAPEVVEPVKESPKQEGTVTEKQISNVEPQGNIDEKTVDTIADKVAEKVKNSMPQPVTVNEFGSEYVDQDDKTANELAESLAKI